MSAGKSDRIIVAKDNLARCQWCGTPESPFWKITQTEKIFCTHECMLASQATNRRLGGIVTIFCGLIFVVPYIYLIIRFPSYRVEFGGAITLVGFSMIFLLCGLFTYSEGKEGQKYKERKDKYRGVSPVVCSYCSHQNSPYIQACQNCGATLADGQFARESTPPWFKQGAASGVYKCPHCRAIYSYRQAPISNEGYVTCQNCVRPFLPSTESPRVEPRSRHFY